MEFVDDQERGFLNKVREFNRAHPLLNYSLKRIGSALITILLAATITFLLLRTLDPSKYYSQFINKYPVAIRDAVKQNILSNLGLDKPVIVQLFQYYYKIIPIFPKTVCMNQSINALGQIVCSESKTVLIDLGTSLIYTPNVAISSIIGVRMPWSVKVGLLSLLIQFPLGYAIGIFMAKYKDKFFDKLGNLYIVIISSIPTIVYYQLIQYIFIKAGVNPKFDGDVLSTWIPVLIALGIMGSTGTAMWVRRFMVDELNADYVKFARSKGLPENKILFKHVLRNAVVPIIRTIPMASAYTLLGAYFAETIFSVPGIGKLLIEAIQKQDNELVQGLVLIFAAISTLAYLFGDIITALVDPRISLVDKD